MRNLPKIIERISKKLSSQNAKIILVGGSVRDYYLNLPIKDYDLEVYGVSSLEKLELLLSEYGDVNLVGKSFGVLKLNYNGEVYDFSSPRKENKIGIGHRGFEIEIDNSLSFKEASKRRDFTINAMGYDIEKDIFLDPYKGLEDIQNRKLKHIDDITFIEDALRVYRAVQFCARFEFQLDKNSFELCHKMVKDGSLETVSKERVFDEFSKLLLKAKKPSIGFTLMQKLGIFKYFPELDKVNFRDLDYKNCTLTFMYVLLLQNLGSKKAKSFLYKITNNHKFIKEVTLFIEYYKIASDFFKNDVKDVDIKKLATKINISDLTTVSKYFDATASAWLLQKAKILHVDKAPLEYAIKGKDLINIGLQQSPKFKNILDDLYDMQLDGIICGEDEIMRVAQKHSHI